MKKIQIGTIALLFLSACSSSKSESELLGQWVEPVPGMEQMEQGIKIENDGKAASINMSTLQYETWKQDGKDLILTGKSIGNGQTIDFSDTLEIKELTNEKLILQRGDLTISYHKKK